MTNTERHHMYPLSHLEIIYQSCRAVKLTHAVLCVVCFEDHKMAKTDKIQTLLLEYDDYVMIDKVHYIDSCEVRSEQTVILSESACHACLS